MLLHLCLKLGTGAILNDPDGSVLFRLGQVRQDIFSDII